MADGDVKIVIDAEDSGVKETLEDVKDNFDEFSEKQKESQKETEKTKSKFEELSETIRKQEKELTDLRGEYTEAIINFGEGSAEANELKEKISSLNNELTENKEVFSKAANEAKELTDALEKNEKSFENVDDSAGENKKSFGMLDSIIGNFVGGSLTNLGGKLLETVGSLIALADETREYREDMAKLTSAFKTAGHSTETAQKAYDGFYKILGESDRSVEAVNHLAELTTNTEEVAKWSNIAAGVTAKFGDSLPIEGLTEAANETAKVGAVTGPLADALNWAGISEDAFNEKLKACNSEQERATLITNTLSTEYQAAAEEYNELTASTQAAREATNRMEQAQAALGASIEPLTTWWTNAKASMLSWASEGVSAVIQGVENIKISNDSLTENQRTLVNGINAQAQAYRDTKAAAAELVAAQMADVDYATNNLIPQLQQIVDSNGLVKQGYEERANFILTQLNAAYGTEYTRISEIIGANGQLTQSIQQAIQAKQAQILLSAHEKAYKEATLGVTEAENKRAEALQSVVAQTKEVDAANDRLKKAQAELSTALESGNESMIRSAGTRVAEAKRGVEAEERSLKELETAYDEADSTLQGYYSDISSYQTAQTLLMEGKTEEALGYLNDINAGYKKSGSSLKASSDEQIAAVENRLEKSAIHLGLLTEEYKTNEKNMTEAQKTEMNARIKAAQNEVDKAGAEAKKLGSALVEGIGVGADGKSDWLSGKLGGIVSSAINAAKKAGIIKSPSRKTRDEVGKPLIQGIVVGAESEEKTLYSTMGGIITNITDYLKKENESQIKTITQYNAEKEAEYKAHAEALAEIEKDKNKAIAEGKEKLEDINKKAFDAEKKQYQTHENNIKTINDNIRKSISDRMTELLSLEADYQTNVKKIWDDLDKSITDLNNNYNEQLKSRAESIANSLNLWNAAEKNKVSGSQLAKNLKSQVKVLEDYNKAIAELEGKGINAEFVQQLKEMGVGATGEIEALAKMTDDELANYVNLWQEKNALAKEAALEELEPLKADTVAQIRDLSDKAVAEYHRLTEEYQKQSVILVEELKSAMEESGLEGYEAIIAQVDDYTSAGADLMDGIITGIVAESPLLAQAVADAVSRAIEAGKDEASGIGFEADDFSLDKYMANLTGKIETTVKSENAKMANGTGTSRSTVDAEIASAIGQNNANLGSIASAVNGQTKAAVTVPINIDGREFGRAVVEYATIEANRTGTSLAFT